ncbi:MAG: ABC transporter ATP-binding protein [Candidatus Berkiellales bacterium]
MSIKQSPSPLLSYQNVSVSYDKIPAIKDVTLHVYEKEIVTLIGANGAGKSTLLMSLFGQPSINQGKIFYANEPIHDLPPYEIAKRGISIAPERRRIFANMTTRENLLMGALSLKNKHEIKTNLDKIYSLFPILSERKQQPAGTLSGGEQQMLSMGRALMNNPKLFLLDEPSLGLSPQMINKIFIILKEIANSGTTLLLIEQNAHLALNLADRAYLLVNGEIQISGQAKKMRQDPRVQAAYLGTL